jgi:hypothetical protein
MNNGDAFDRMKNKVSNPKKYRKKSPREAVRILNKIQRSKSIHQEDDSSCEDQHRGYMGHTLSSGQKTKTKIVDIVLHSHQMLPLSISN